MTIIVFKRNWVVHWYWVIINLLVIMILLSLSYWQWQRAAQKQQSLDQLAHWQTQPATSLAELLAHSRNEINLLASDGARVTFTAQWIAPIVWLLDNQLVKGRPGYDVIIPVQDTSASSSAIALLNLGWVAAPPSRAELPELSIPTDVVVHGVYRARSDALLLGKNLEDHGRWPMRIQKIDNQLLARYLPAELLPGIIYQQHPTQQQNALQQPLQFLIHYRPVVLPPEQHKAYSLQWLLLAIAALLVGLACARETAYQCEAARDSGAVRAATPQAITHKNSLAKNSLSENKVSAKGS